VPAGVGESLERLVERGVLFRALWRFYRRRLTQRGRFLLGAVVLLALLGVDTRRSVNFVLFSVAVPPLLLAVLQLGRRTPRLRVQGRLPSRLTAGRPLGVGFELRPAEPDGELTLSVAWAAPLPPGLSARRSQAYVTLRPGRASRFELRLQADRRGRYRLPDLGLARTDAFGLVRSRGVWLGERVLLACPRYFTLDEAPLPLGRRYQPGGIPLASEVGDSLEFVGTREYRDGDPPRRIDWRSWARLGIPVVKEYQEEYFSRIALVLDTFLPRRPHPAQRRRLEAAISVTASIAEHFSRREEVVDVLAAGPDLYEVSTGRSLGSLDNVLEVLACLEPCPAAPFEGLRPALFERLERLTTVVAVMLDWDEPREAFVRQLQALGVAVHVWLVHEGETRRPCSLAAPLAEVRRITPAEVDERLLAEEAL